jgi:hypothetical protein
MSDVVDARPEVNTETPLQPGANEPVTKFTREQALDWLAANPNTRHIREIAAHWGWSRSTTQRFVFRFGGSSAGTSVRQTPENKTLETPEAPIATAPYRDDFDWSPENEAVIMPTQQAIAVYFNRWGQIVIRAEGADGDEDVFIAIAPEHLPAVIAKLSAILKERAG